MTWRGHRRRPCFELFESRALLSAESGVAAGIAADTSRRVTETAVRLAGTIHGNYELLGIPIFPDAGTINLFTGEGHVGGLGHATASGDIQGVGFTTEGRAQGEFTLRRGRNSIALQLTALQEQPGSAGLPSDYSYAITAGTGRYKDARSSGLATLAIFAARGDRGGLPERFTLVLRPSGIPH
jgi:hypothetical protein